MRARATSRVDRTVLRIVVSCAVLAGPAAAGRASAADGSVIVSHRARGRLRAHRRSGAAALEERRPAWSPRRTGFGKVVPHHRTEIRSRWTDKNVYLLFIAPYEEL